MKNLSYKKSGFTLVEAMVAISILALSITGPMLIAQKGIGSSIYSRDQVVAAYLAQEAVEYIRNTRDTNRINGSSWLTNLNSCSQSVSPGSRCAIDARYPNPSTVGAIISCPSGNCPVLNIESSTGLYGYGSGGTWKSTAFTRSVSVDNRYGGGKEAEISVTISWTTKLFTPVRSFTIKEYIFDF